jgi:hypothetical protein
MTARTGKARGYFSQLVEPAPEGEPVFSARKDLSAPSARMPPPIPVIEDVVYDESQPGRTASQLPQRYSSTLNSAPIIQTSELRNEKTVATAERASRSASETTIVQSSTRRNQESESAYVRPSSATINRAEPLEQRTNEGPRNPNLNYTRPAIDSQESLSLRESGVMASAEHSSEANTTRGAIIPAKKAPGAPSHVAASNDHPAQLQTIRAESRPPVASVRSISRESAQNFGGQMPDAKGSSAPSNLFNNQKTSSNASANANHQSVKSGPRVVIGTVEIRTRISQPPPIAAAPVQRIPDRNLDQANLHGGARPARLDSLVRGLGWNFGLIQG